MNRAMIYRDMSDFYARQSARIADAIYDASEMRDALIAECGRMAEEIADLEARYMAASGHAARLKGYSNES